MDKKAKVILVAHKNCRGCHEQPILMLGQLILILGLLNKQKKQQEAVKQINYY